MRIGRKIVHLHALPHLMRLHLLCLLKRGVSAWAGTMVFTGIVSSRLAPFNTNHTSFLCCAYCCNSVIALKHTAPSPRITLTQPPSPPAFRPSMISLRTFVLRMCAVQFAYTYSFQCSALASCLSTEHSNTAVG